MLDDVRRLLPGAARGRRGRRAGRARREGGEPGADALRWSTAPARSRSRTHRRSPSCCSSTSRRPVSIRRRAAQAWDLVRRMCELGKTVLLTTHYMEEAQALADRVVVIVGGAEGRRGHARVDRRPGDGRGRDPLRAAGRVRAHRTFPSPRTRSPATSSWCARRHRRRPCTSSPVGGRAGGGARRAHRRRARRSRTSTSSSPASDEGRTS